jgi:FkbM family methyltransferase
MLKLFRRFREKKLGKLEKEYSRPSFAQEGEDLILEIHFQGKKTPGFYVDVGAFHPFRFSNTYHFYKKGWHGINIDATPGAMSAFERHRPRDINLEQPIAQEGGELPFYIFNEPALNGFSKTLSEARDAGATPGPYHIIQTLTLHTAPLSEVLDHHLPPGQPIDFLSVDAEGLDLEVLRSNNWDKYRPEVVLAEAADGTGIEGVLNSEASQFMREKGYDLMARTPRTLFFQRRST